MKECDKRVFAIFENWKLKKTSLGITGLIWAGLSTASRNPNCSAYISDVDVDSCQLYMETDSRPLVLDLTDAVFAIQENGSAFNVSVTLQDGSVVYFVELS